MTLIDLPLLHSVYSSMNTLGEEVGIRMVQADPITGDITRCSRNLAEELDLLSMEGSFDSLALVVLRAQEAFIQCRVSDHDQIAKFAAYKVPSWTCLEWVPTEVQALLVNAILDGIHRIAPEPLFPLSLARSHCLTQSILSLEYSDRESLPTAINFSQIGNLLFGSFRHRKNP